MAELLLHTHDEKKGILCQATSQTETRASWISHLATTARHLTEAEIAQLEAQGNTSSDGSWQNLLVPPRNSTRASSGAAGSRGRWCWDSCDVPG